MHEACVISLNWDTENFLIDWFDDESDAQAFMDAIVRDRWAENWTHVIVRSVEGTKRFAMRHKVADPKTSDPA